MTKLRDLSLTASPGRLFATNRENFVKRYRMDGAKTLAGDESEPKHTVSLNPETSGWNTDSGYPDYCISRENAEFIAELWNAYREGRLVEIQHGKGEG